MLRQFGYTFFLIFNINNMDKYKREISIKFDLLKDEVNVVLIGFCNPASAVIILKNAIKKIENL